MGAVVLYDDSLVPAANTRPRENLTVTLRGGAVTINGLKFSEIFEELPALEAQTEGLFLLQRIGQRLFLARQDHRAVAPIKRTTAGLADGLRGTTFA